MKKALLALLLVAVGITVYGYLSFTTSEFIPDIRTVSVTQGDVVDSVGATGALEAVTTVNVGSQVSGTIQDLLVDFNSIVRKGDVIMRLDPELFETQLEQARANLIRSEADVERLRVSRDDVRVQLRRAEDLAARELISVTELEAAQVAVRSAEAQLKSSEAAVIQSEASLSQNQVDLDNTIIRAPIDGIVISRLVDIGQTIAASMQAPELFLIAADLTKMRVIANIDESDVGRIRPNQRVTFTVDAYPGEEFEGLVSQIRLEPVVTQNVVTYATVVDAPNQELRLKPGMTATISLEIARRENVLRIPNSALRFRPTPEMFSVLNQPVPAALQRPNWNGSVQSSNGFQGATPLPAAGVTALQSSPLSNSPGEGAGFGGAGGRGAPDPEQMRQFRERLQQMSSEERQQFFAQRRAGAENSASGDAPANTAPGSTRTGGRPVNLVDAPNIPTVDRGATTIDALFGALPSVEIDGRVWVLNGDRLEAVNVRLGVTDGTASELLGGDRSLLAGATLVTNITTPDNDPAAASGRSGSPLMPQFGRRRR